MRQAQENAAVEQWRNYLDPSAIIAYDLGYQRVDDDLRVSVLKIMWLSQFERTALSAYRLASCGVPFDAVLRLLKMPPERK